MEREAEVTRGGFLQENTDLTYGVCLEDWNRNMKP